MATISEPMKTKVTPLVSDEQMGHRLGRMAVRDIYEQDRQELLALLKQAVERIEISSLRLSQLNNPATFSTNAAIRLNDAAVEMINKKLNP